MKKFLFIFVGILSGLILSTSIFATPLCLQRTAGPLLLSVDMRTATSWPAETVSLVGATYSRFRDVNDPTTALTVQPVIGTGVLRTTGFWIFSIEGVPTMKLDREFNPVYPEGWVRVGCLE